MEASQKGWRSAFEIGRDRTAHAGHGQDERIWVAVQWTCDWAQLAALPKTDELLRRRDQHTKTCTINEKGNGKRWNKNIGSYAKIVPVLKKKNKIKELAQVEKDRLNDFVAASAINASNFILAPLHSFTTTYAFLISQLQHHHDHHKRKWGRQGAF